MSGNFRRPKVVTRCWGVAGLLMGCKPSRNSHRKDQGATRKPQGTTGNHREPQGATRMPAAAAAELVLLGCCC